MKKTFFAHIPAYQFHLFQKFSGDVSHAVFSRLGGVSKAPFESLNVSFEVNDDTEQVEHNRKLIASACNLPLENIVSGHQTHSKNVLIIDENVLSQSKKTSFHEHGDVDAFITNVLDVGLMIKVADCQALFMFDPVRRVIAAIHAGWKGLVKDISGETLRLMRERFNVNPAQVLVGISPSLGPCCSYFSNPEEELPTSFRPYTNRQNQVDLWQYSIDQLQSHGILLQNIENARVCTACGGGSKFFSFRRDKGITGRFGNVVWLRA